MTNSQTQDFIDNTRKFMYLAMGDGYFTNYLSNKTFLFSFQMDTSYILVNYKDSKTREFHSLKVLIKNLRKWLKCTRRQLEKYDANEIKDVAKELDTFCLFIGFLEYKSI